MAIRENIMKQFGKPVGLLGSLAGFIMAHRKSNLERNQWAVDLLQLKAYDSVLETGYGPGQALRMISRVVTNGTIYGLDHSEKMRSAAEKRNKAAIRKEQMKLQCAEVSMLSQLDMRIDKVLDVNSFQFWENPVQDLIVIRTKMNRGGMIALVQQPRKQGATDQDALDAGLRYSTLLEQAGFQDIVVHRKPMKPVMTICVTGRSV